MSDLFVDHSFLVFAALDERGDMNVLTNAGNSITYADFKIRTLGLRLSFPSCYAARTDPLFQVWSFVRHADGLLLCRSMIAGGASLSGSSSGDSLRPLPVFEVFDLRGDFFQSPTSDDPFLKVIQNLDFPAYPAISSKSGDGYVKKPDGWYRPKKLDYGHSVVNKKRKEWKPEEGMKDWGSECQRGIDKLLWFALFAKRVQSGISLCFTADDFRKFDMCTYVYDRMNLAIWQYQLGELG